MPKLPNSPLPPPVPGADNEGASKPDSPVKMGGDSTATPGKPRYGINEAIALMRRLPSGDMRILSQVIKETLESTNVSVTEIIEDAESKESGLEVKIRKLDEEVSGLEALIKERKDSIAAYLEDLEETRNVKNNLLLASETEGESVDSSEQKGTREVLEEKTGIVTAEPSNQSGQSLGVNGELHSSPVENNAKPEEKQFSLENSDTGVAEKDSEEQAPKDGASKKPEFGTSDEDSDSDERTKSILLDALFGDDTPDKKSS